MTSADPISGLSVDSSAFRRRAPRVQLSEDPDTANAQTVQEMCRQIAMASRDSKVRWYAFDAVRRFRGGPIWIGTGLHPFKSPQVMAESCFWWCKHAMRFKHHSTMFEVWADDLGDPADKMQLLIAPDILVRMDRMYGDCAIYTMMLCAMLESLGVRWEICTAAVDWKQPSIFSHVWPRAVLEDGVRESLDASHGKQPGWQVPARDIHRLKVWDESGRESAHYQGPQFAGLHAYRPRRGFGQVDVSDGFTPVEPISSPSPSTLTPSWEPLTASPYYNPTQVFGSNITPDWAALPSSTQITVPSQSSAQWASFANAAVKAGMTLAALQAMQPGTVINPSGQIIRQSPGYAVTTGGPVGGAFAPLSTGSSSSVLMIGGLVIGGLVLFSMLKGGR